MAINENNSDRLKELGGSDFEIADGQPNIKGWEVRDTVGHDIGEIDELIFDPNSRKVLYLVVDLDDNDLNLDSKKVLVPIGLATLHEKDDEVILAELTARQLATLPEYDKGNITPSTEATIRNAFSGLASAMAAGATSYESHPDDFYQHEHFDENRFYGTRKPSDEIKIPVVEEELNIGKKEVQTGGVSITSNIVEHPVTEQINLQEERVHIERVPVNKPANSSDFDTFQEGEIEFVESKEVPVINKEVRVVEEISVNKEVTERQETIHDTVRRTEVDIEDIEPDNLDRQNRKNE